MGVLDQGFILGISAPRNRLYGIGSTVAYFRRWEPPKDASQPVTEVSVQAALKSLASSTFSSLPSPPFQRLPPTLSSLLLLSSVYAESPSPLTSSSPTSYLCASWLVSRVQSSRPIRLPSYVSSVLQSGRSDSCFGHSIVPGPGSQVSQWLPRSLGQLSTPRPTRPSRQNRASPSRFTKISAGGWGSTGLLRFFPASNLRGAVLRRRRSHRPPRSRYLPLPRVSYPTTTFPMRAQNAPRCGHGPKPSGKSSCGKIENRRQKLMGSRRTWK